MQIHEVVIKHYLKNVMFINGTAYAGKSTMAAMLAEKYDLVLCGENYHGAVSEKIATPDVYPNLCYFKTMRDWQEFIHRTPEEYAKWIEGASQEAVEFEIPELIRLSKDRRVIADTNIPVELLWKIADYHQVALMLAPQSMSVDMFFERTDADKQFLLARIREAPDPDAAMRNFRACMARINSREVYDQFFNSGFFTIVREDAKTDTREATLARLASHFGLDKPG